MCWDGYSSFYLALVYFLCAYAKCYLHISYCLNDLEGIWLGFCIWFREAGLDLVIEVILQVSLRRVEYLKSCWHDSKHSSHWNPVNISSDKNYSWPVVATLVLNGKGYLLLTINHIKFYWEVVTAMFRDKRPEKRLRLAGPPPHTRFIHMSVRLEWSYKQ